MTAPMPNLLPTATAALLSGRSDAAFRKHLLPHLCLAQQQGYRRAFVVQVDVRSGSRPCHLGR